MASNNRSDNTNRETRILDTAARLIAHYGYDKTTVSDIAREAGVSKGAIYLHWPSKEALLEALLQREELLLMDKWFERIVADPQGGAVYGMFYHLFLTLEASPFIRAIYTRDMRVLGDYMRLKPELAEQRFEMDRTAFAQMQQAGLLRDDVSAGMITYLLVAVSTGLLSVGEFIPDNPHTPTYEETARALAEMLDQQLTPPGGGDSAVAKAYLAQYLERIRQAYNPDSSN